MGHLLRPVRGRVQLRRVYGRWLVLLRVQVPALFEVPLVRTDGDDMPWIVGAPQQRFTLARRHLLERPAVHEEEARLWLGLVASASL